MAEKPPEELRRKRDWFLTRSLVRYPAGATSRTDRPKIAPLLQVIVRPASMNARQLIRGTLLLLAVAVIYHFVLRWLMIHTDLILGAVGPGNKVYRIVPIYAYCERHVNIWLVVCLLGVTAYVRWVVRAIPAGDGACLRADQRGFAWKLAGWFLVVVVTVAMLDGGPRRLWRPFDVLRNSDYIGGVAAVQSPRDFLRDYVALRHTLPMHCQTHPPGAVLFLWTVDRSLGPGPVAASIVAILVAALSVPAVVGLACRAMESDRGRFAGALFVLAPNVVLFTATSMDAVFMVPMIWTVYLLFHAVEEPSRRRAGLLGLLAGMSASLAAMMTFSAALLAVWAISLGLFVLFLKRECFPATLVALAAALGTSILFYGLLYLVSGYNLIEMLREAVGSHESIMQGGNYTSLRQYLHLVVGNLAAFLVGSGIPITVLYLSMAKQDLSALKTRLPGKGLSLGRLLNYTFLATLTLTLVAPLYTLEVERIWIFLVPFLTIGAARRLENTSGDAPFPAARLALSLVALQTIVMESFLETLW